MPEVFVPVSGTFQERMMGAQINGENVADRVVKLPVGNIFGEGCYMVYFKQSPTFGLQYSEILVLNANRSIK